MLQSAVPSQSALAPDLSERAAVAVWTGPTARYPHDSPFHPAEMFPELARFGHTATGGENAAYLGVRESLRLLGLDAANYGQPQWNPLGSIVRPGEHVLIKPNWVSHRHDRDDSWEQIITHGSVLRATIDYVQIALAGRGRITLADGPMLGSDFAEICRRSGVDGICQYYQRLPGAAPLECLDLRNLLFVTRDAVVVDRMPLPGDPRGAVVVNLATGSALYGYRGEGRYYGADYDIEEVNRHHRGELQEYQLSGSAMSADVIIDVPKLKTHHKVGVTLALKGVVGLNCGRNWLPHRTQGTPAEGGDQFSGSGLRQRLESRLVRGFEKASLRFPRTVPGLYRWAKRMGRKVFGASHVTIRGGGWYGNDTLWRMVHDINRALTYADSAGRLQAAPARRRFVIVDGIVAGQGMGPIGADPVACGTVLAGHNPVAVDTAAAELMGFDHSRIPMIAQAYRPHALPLAGFQPADIRLLSNRAECCGDLDDLRRASPFRFQAPLGWNNYMERDATAEAAASASGAGLTRGGGAR